MKNNFSSKFTIIRQSHVACTIEYHHSQACVLYVHREGYIHPTKPYINIGFCNIDIAYTRKDIIANHCYKSTIQVQPLTRHKYNITCKKIPSLCFHQQIGWNSNTLVRASFPQTRCCLDLGCQHLRPPL